MKLKGLAEYLESNRVGQMGKSLFIGEMPHQAESGILLIDAYAGTPINHEIPKWRETGFRVVVRSPGYEAGQALAEKVLQVLTIQRDVRMNGFLMRQCLPAHDPLPYRRSKGSAIWEFEVDFDCVYILP